MAANKHTNKLKIQNYAYEISNEETANLGQLVPATQDGNYFEIPLPGYFGSYGEYPLIEAMDIDWRPYTINGEQIITTSDVLNKTTYLYNAYAYTLNVICENEETIAEALNVLNDKLNDIETSYVDQDNLPLIVTMPYQLQQPNNVVSGISAQFVDNQYVIRYSYVGVPSYSYVHSNYTSYAYLR